VAAARLRQVTLVKAWEPGAAGAEGDSIEFAIALDAAGMPDVEAWLQDADIWPVTRRRGGATPQQGDVLHDEDGWQLRFFPDADGDPDMPVHRIRHIGGGLRPGEVLTLRDPEGRESAWRVVGVA
jgi:hypothetical protein